MASTLPMLRRRRAAAFAERFAVRVLEGAVGVAERLAGAVAIAERAWATGRGRVNGQRREGIDGQRREPFEVVQTGAAQPAPEVVTVVEPPLSWALARHLSAQVDRRARQIFDLDPWAPGADRVEHVHDMRVGSRRLRSFVDLFRPQLPPKLATRLRRNLRRIGRGLGPLRELDVHVQGLDARRRASPNASERAALEYVLEWLERRRRRAERRARKTLADIDFEMLRADLREATDRVVGPLARPDADVGAQVETLLLRRIEATFADMPDPGIELEIAPLHDIRVRAKRLRYAVEFLRPALGDAYAELRRPLRRFHRVVGDLHDHSLLQALIVQRHAKLADNDRATLAAGLASVLAGVQQRSAGIRRNVPGSLAGLDRGRFEAAVRGGFAAGDRSTVTGVGQDPTIV